MDIQILLGLLLTVLPVFELRGGLPIIVDYALRHGISVWPYFIIVIILNILVIFLIFFFFDFLHELLMGWKFYRKIINTVLVLLQKKIEKVHNKMDCWGYLALMFFVAIPLPGSGAWTGALIAWTLGLNRLKSFIAIASGVIIAGFLVLLFSLGLLPRFY